VEKAVASIGAENGLLRSIGQSRVNGRFVKSSDLAGLGPWAGNTFEITTKQALAAHMDREYGLDVHYALYDVPSSWYEFLQKNSH
jgi:hypothetical protein